MIGEEQGPNGRAIVVTGFMGAGKTTAARALAAESKTSAVDSDAVLEKQLGCSIQEFFEKRGERAFREHEERAVCDLLEKPPSPVISLGGGAIMSGAVRAALQRHIVVLIDVDAEVAWQRAGGRRPLARDWARFETLLSERRPLYEQLANVILPGSDRAVIRAVLPAIKAWGSAPPTTKLIWAQAQSGSYPVYVGAGLLECQFWPFDSRGFLITDANAGDLYADNFQSALAGEIRIETGEQHKTLEVADDVLQQLAERGMERQDVLVALGGGVVGDLGGFCAAVYQRGVRFVQVPTTIVSQVDSAYGGKVGVDLPQGKNYVGAFHHPSAVITDPTTLESLPKREQASGWAEIVKTALIAGDPLWEQVRQAPAGELPTPEVITGCIRTKLRIVSLDERDAGQRQLLNLGHTVGHAIETVTNYRRYSHGEAVGLGLLCALTLSALPGLRDEVATLLSMHGLTTRLDKDVDIDDVLVALKRDKKTKQGRPRFVLVDGPGDLRVNCVVTENETVGALKDVQN